MDKTNSPSIKALLFDLGGVVMDINFDNIFRHWADSSNCSPEEIRSKFSFDCCYEAHERGEIDSVKYFDSLRKTLGIELSDRQFESGWNSIYQGIIPGMPAILRKAMDKWPIYAFTNSNRSHQNVWAMEYSEILSCFQIVFSSWEIGQRKPEPEAFITVADGIGVKLCQIAFFDDSLENIDGAKKIGMKAIHVKTVADIEHGIKQMCC